MDSRKMKLIPEPSPGTRTVLVKTTAGPFMKGDGPRSYRCGTCNATLLRNVGHDQIQHIVFKCLCGAFNEIPRADQTN